MSKRIQRVNELLQRELSEQLRRHYGREAVNVTISGVETTPDLRQARVFYSVLGGGGAEAEACALFERIGGDLSRRASRRIILKYFPRLEFVHDPSLRRGAEILEIIEEIDHDTR